MLMHWFLSESKLKYDLVVTYLLKTIKREVILVIVVNNKISIDVIMKKKRRKI